MSTRVWTVEQRLDSLFYRLTKVDNIVDEKERASFASSFLVEAIDLNDAISVKFLLTRGATIATTTSATTNEATESAAITTAKFLKLVVKGVTSHRDSINGNWELLKLGLANGIKLTDSLESCNCIYYYYLLHGIGDLIKIGDRLEDSEDVYNNLYGGAKRKECKAEVEAKRKECKAKVETKEQEMINDLHTFLRCGRDAELALQKNFDNKMIIDELSYFCRQTSSQMSNGSLLKFLLDRGLNPNFSNLYQGVDSLLYVCLDHESWKCAAVLLEYGATVNGMPLPFFKTSDDGSLAHVTNLQEYIDDTKDATNLIIDDSGEVSDNAKSEDSKDSEESDPGGRKELRTGLENLRRRREQVYPAHLKLALGPACNSCDSYSSFDVAPLTIIISEYLL